MNKVTIAVRLILAIIITGVGIVATSVVFPSHVSAAEVSVQTAQLLPPGSNTCAPLAASGFTPYVYDNALHAFEFTLQDSSYVAVIGTVGNTNIPLNQMRRQVDATGALRIHVDVATTPIRGSLPITVTLLSAKGPGQPVCVSVVVTTLLGSGAATPTPVPAPAPSSGASSAPAPKPSTPATTTAGSQTKPSSVGDKDKTKTGTSTAALAVTQNVVTALKDICSPKNAPTLWVILLVLYAAGVAAVVFGKPKMPAFMQSQESIAAAIVVPFLLLFGLWYFAESCRINAWAPAIATIIALAGLSVAFWEKPKSVQGVINLPSAKS
ncbi:hypothetical protein A3A40_00705 [Candidatus Kaiserbacteria bacterium RIFCSPLOWO2_01_FULL_54_20]|uniref:Uncharacterized protein n=1 Tax=Candidatus Kaiserbacteria bacterium RIFCSPLOWO2_01_FULL_54_20 TaxID=1798513 RepID=A0A1F6EJJ8_9BACT|nr:MAG: hypothetical protein A3A40_00705 [Candidatus Kaiserbacteria bacterium RIFCSPLOWO2_01_FULL_54_20]